MINKKFQSRSIYERTQKSVHIPLHIIGILCAVVLFAPYQASTNVQPYEQEFIITAYYSPLEGQCCYVKGGYEADKILNGQGISAADGTGVYPGMIAAPSSYSFGSKVKLPSIGVFTVHDRGGAINELGNGTHRLDIWVGHGEEGLARALEFGVVRVKGTVYPKSHNMPATVFNIKTFSAPLSRLFQYQLDQTTLLDIEHKVNDYSYSVVMLQEKLKLLGYFSHDITGVFGEVTQNSLRRFIVDYKINQPSDKLTQKSASIILSAVYRMNANDPIENSVNESSSPKVISQAQRILRFLGYYSGRTDGKYSKNLAESILKFQQEYWLVGTAQDPGAGQIGPITSKHLFALWDRTLVSAFAEKLLLKKDIEEYLDKNGDIMKTFLHEGNMGPQVRLLQQLLTRNNFFPEEEINGYFGPLTKESVTKYQISKGIISSRNSHGAGIVGPATLSFLRQEEMRKLYKLVRAEGWAAL
ncbi:MAG: peptidoglycan-binding protein [Candidatus Peribacteraceae bacterium]|nr:peptidoglycan-binding protein [Candidatus Peribacteraceae bacterium]